MPRTRLRVTSPAPRDAWRELLAADPDGLVDPVAGVARRALRATGYEDASRLYETAVGHAARAAAGAARRARGRRRSRRGRRCRTAWGMGGLVAVRRRSSERDVAAVAADLAADSRAASPASGPNPLHAALWAARARRGAVAIPRRAHVLDLDGGADAVWDQRFRSNARKRIRKAERAGLEVECDTTGRLVPVFYELLRALGRALGRRSRTSRSRSPGWRARRRDPIEKFERMAAALGDAMRVWVAWKDGVPVRRDHRAPGRATRATRAGAMDKDARRRRRAPTTCSSGWRSRTRARRAAARYHLGESGRSQSLAHYKEKFGARPVDYAEYRFERLPLTRADALARSLVKRVLRFRDA